MVSLAGLEYRTVREISGPLIFVEQVRGVGYGELARIRTPRGKREEGRSWKSVAESQSSRSSKEHPDLTFRQQVSVSPEKPSNYQSHRTCLVESSTAAVGQPMVARESSLTIIST